MSQSSESLLERVLALPADERGMLAAQLIASLQEAPENDVERAWSAEIQRRLAEIEARQVKMIPWNEARQRVRESGHAAD